MDISKILPSGALPPRRIKFGIPSLILMIFFSAGYFMIGESQFTGDNIVVEGRVIDIRTTQNSDGGNTYAPIVEYSVDGEEYRATTGFTSSGQPSIGAVHKVSYEPGDPSKGKAIASVSDGPFWIMALFRIVGLLFIGGGIFSFVKSLKRTADIKKLTNSGQKVAGVLVDIRVKNGKQSHYQLVVAAPGQNSEVKEYVSDKLVGIPAGLIGMDMQKAALPIDVYLNPSNYDNYYVDLSDVPALTPQRIQDLINNAATGVLKNQNQFQSNTTTATETPIVPKSAHLELVDYVESQRAAGYTDDTISTNLQNAGWQEDNIRKALS